MAKPPVAWTLLLGLALIKLGIHLLSSVLTYGYMTDELYYLDCADHLAWGYVDHPPLSIALLALLRLTLGDSLIALRLVPALAGSATIVVVGLMARELGGGRVAQSLAALAALVAPVYLGIDAFYSMNAFEPVWWALAAYLLLRLANGATPRLWLLIGVVIGLGLLNKISMLWFGLGLVVGLLLTPQRRWLLTPWPWLAGAIALALFAPHIMWQAQNGWPTLEFMHNAMQFKMQAKSPLRFLAEQVLIMNPLLLPFWLSGLAYYFIAEPGRRFRLLAWIWITVLVLLIVSGSTRSNYMGPAYVLLLPAAGVAVEQLVRRRSWYWLPPALAGVFAVGGALVAPMAVDLLPPEQYVFGDAGAINFFGPSIGLPRAISGHNNYWLWGLGTYSGEVMLVLVPPDSAVLELFDHVELASRIRCDYCLPALTEMGVYICRGPRRPLPELWPQLKNYV